MNGDNDERFDGKATLARIDERTKWICDTLKKQGEVDIDHEIRIRKLETSQAEQQGITRGQAMQSAGAGGATGAMATILVMKLLALLGFGGP